MVLINRRIGWNSKWSEKGVGYREGGREFNFYYVTVGRALHDRSTKGKSPPLSLPPSQNFNRSRVLKAIRECFQACYKSITIHDGGRGREGKRLVRHTNIQCVHGSTGIVWHTFSPLYDDISQNPFGHLTGTCVDLV